MSKRWWERGIGDDEHTIRSKGGSRRQCARALRCEEKTGLSGCFAGGLSGGRSRFRCNVEVECEGFDRVTRSS